MLDLLLPMSWMWSGKNRWVTRQRIPEDSSPKTANWEKKRRER